MKKPVLHIRVSHYIRRCVQANAKRLNTTESGVVNRILSNYYASHKRAELSCMPDFEDVTCQDIEIFITMNGLTYTEFSDRMFVRPETIGRWIKNNTRILPIYQQQFRRVRHHFPETPPL